MVDLARSRIIAAADCWSLLLYPEPDPENDVELPAPFPADVRWVGVTASADVASCGTLSGGAGVTNGLLSKIELMLSSNPISRGARHPRQICAITLNKTLMAYQKVKLG